jgi:hypothetical protein
MSVKVTYVGPTQRKYIISAGDKLADINAINFIGRRAVHTKMMVVITALVAPTNIWTTGDCRTDENRSR